MFAARFAGFLACFATAIPALAQGVARGNFGDWEHRCEATSAGPTANCILYQNVADEQNDQFNIVVIIIKIADPMGQKRPALRVIAPLGVLLPKGLTLKIDQKEVGSTGFIRCVPTGCVAEVAMDDTLVDSFSTADTAVFSVFQTETDGKGLPVGLKGFAAGLAALK